MIAAPKCIETKIHANNGFEDLFEGLQWVVMPISEEPPKEVKINHFGKVNSVKPENENLAPPTDN